MMEVSGEPADAYVGAYAMVSGLSAISAGLFGGMLGKFINNGVIYIFWGTILHNKILPLL